MQHVPLGLVADPLASKLGYLQRILDYAFGAQGDKVILENHIGKSEVERFNKEAEIIDYYSERSLQGQNQLIPGEDRRRTR